jgi:hypothetical protein
MSTLRILDDHVNGVVACPVRGQLAPVEVCASCQWLVDVQDVDGATTVRCAPPAVARLFAPEAEVAS